MVVIPVLWQTHCTPTWSWIVSRHNRRRHTIKPIYPACPWQKPPYPSGTAAMFSLRCKRGEWGTPLRHCIRLCSTPTSYKPPCFCNKSGSRIFTHSSVYNISWVVIPSAQAHANIPKVYVKPLNHHDPFISLSITRHHAFTDTTHLILDDIIQSVTTQILPARYGYLPIHNISTWSSVL